MSLLQRGVVFTAGTTTNALIFLFHSRVVLELLAIADSIAGQGPATGALNTLPVAMQLGMGLFQVGLIAYFIAGIGQERSATRRPMP